MHIFRVIRICYGGQNMGSNTIKYTKQTVRCMAETPQKLL